MVDRSAHVEPFTFRMPLTVCVDVKHPACYLALGPVLALARELDVEVDWLPFPVPLARRPPEPGAGEDRGSRHRRIRARYQDADLQRYAAVQGLTIRGMERSPDTALASLGLLWLNRHAPGRCADYLQRLCAGYWNETLDVEDADAVAAVLVAIGEDPQAFAAFAAGRGPAALAALRESLSAAGVFAVPSLVVEGEVFVGRAHLPMVRWLLRGRSGPAPI